MSKKRNFLDVSILWQSELHLLESLTDEFSVLEPFLIATLPVEFSQEGATEERESYIRLRHEENRFSTKTKRCVQSQLLETI